MTKAERRKAIIFFAVIALVFMVGAILTDNGAGKHETIQEMMRDAVLHEVNKVSLFGIMDVNPGMLAGVIVSGFLIVLALICRIFISCLLYSCRRLTCTSKTLSGFRMMPFFDLTYFANSTLFSRLTAISFSSTFASSWKARNFSSSAPFLRNPLPIADLSSFVSPGLD